METENQRNVYRYKERMTLAGAFLKKFVSNGVLPNGASQAYRLSLGLLLKILDKADEQGTVPLDTLLEFEDGGLLLRDSIYLPGESTGIDKTQIDELFYSVNHVSYDEQGKPCYSLPYDPRPATLSFERFVRLGSPRVMTRKIETVSELRMRDLTEKWEM